MTGDERFDVFDERMNKTGTATRAEVHAEGLWHQTFHCWILSREEDGIYVLFQLRHRSKDTFPGLLDVSCAGHLLAGETPMDGIRELREELGLDVHYSELNPCGVFPEEDIISDGFIDREYCHVYIYDSNQPLTSYRMQPDEVSGLFRVRLDNLKRLLQEGEPIAADGIVLNGDGTVSRQVRMIRKADLVPHPNDYFQLLFDAVENM